MYNVGQLIVYGNEGVCRVEKIGASENAGANKDRQYYTLIPLARNGKVTVPVDSGVFSRPIISRAEAEDILSCVVTVEAEVFSDRNLKLLTDRYKEAMQSCACIDMVRTVKSIKMKRLRAIAAGKKLGTIDERFLKRAEDMLYGELSVALEETKEAVKKIVEEKLAICIN